MERGKTIQQAMRKVFREVREEYRTKEQNTIAHPLVDKCVEVGKTNHFNSTINSVLIYLCGIHLARQMDPFFTPQNIHQIWARLSDFQTLCHPYENENMQIMLFSAERTVQQNQERLDMAFTFELDQEQNEEN